MNVLVHNQNYWGIGLDFVKVKWRQAPHRESTLVTSVHRQVDANYRDVTIATADLTGEVIEMLADTEIDIL